MPKKKEQEDVNSEEFFEMWTEALSGEDEFSEFFKAVKTRWSQMDTIEKVKQKCYALNTIVAKRTTTTETPYGRTLKLPPTPGKSKHGATQRYIDGNMDKWDAWLSVKKPRKKKDKSTE